MEHDVARRFSTVRLAGQAELDGDYTTRLALMEDMKVLPFGAVWDEHCRRMNVPGGQEWLREVKRYEADVLGARS